MKPLDRINVDWVLASEIHKLEARLWSQIKKSMMKIILLTSASRGDGKSTTMAYLSTALALHPDRRILVIDMDMRAPQLSEHFDVKISHTLGSVILGKCSPKEAIVTTDLPNLDLLMPAAGGEDPVLLLKSQEIAFLFESLRQDYDLILVDAPALLPVADTSALLAFVDGVVIMAMAEKTTKHQLSRARDIILGMDVNILGLIIANFQAAQEGYGGYGYYEGYDNYKSYHKKMPTKS